MPGLFEILLQITVDYRHFWLIPRTLRSYGVRPKKTWKIPAEIYKRVRFDNSSSFICNNTELQNLSQLPSVGNASDESRPVNIKENNIP